VHIRCSEDGKGSAKKEGVSSENIEDCSDCSDYEGSKGSKGSARKA
jgi:hypothetical protein